MGTNSPGAFGRADVQNLTEEGGQGPAVLWCCVYLQGDPCTARNKARDVFEIIVMDLSTLKHQHSQCDALNTSESFGAAHEITKCRLMGSKEEVYLGTAGCIAYITQYYNLVLYRNN